jgi:hypothetical protein
MTCAHFDVGDKLTAYVEKWTQHKAIDGPDTYNMYFFIKIYSRNGSLETRMTIREVLCAMRLYQFVSLLNVEG